MTDERKDCITATKKVADSIDAGSILEIGLAGDARPSGSYLYFKDFQSWTTLDKLPEERPDVVFDLEEGIWIGQQFDLVICLNVLEHLFNVHPAGENLKAMTGKYLFIATPWNYPYHPEPGFDDYCRYTPAFFKKMFSEYKVIADYSTDNLTSILFKK